MVSVALYFSVIGELQLHVRLCESIEGSFSSSLAVIDIHEIDTLANSGSLLGICVASHIAGSFWLAYIPLLAIELGKLLHHHHKDSVLNIYASNVIPDFD